jgi:hypothetical protein
LRGRRQKEGIAPQYTSNWRSSNLTGESAGPTVFDGIEDLLVSPHLAALSPVHPSPSSHRSRWPLLPPRSRPSPSSAVAAEPQFATLRLDELPKNDAPFSTYTCAVRRSDQPQRPRLPPGCFPWRLFCLAACFFGDLHGAQNCAERPSGGFFACILVRPR